jgi:hypothetical protein
MIPAAYLQSLGVTVFDPVGSPLFPGSLDAPEANSIALIGWGLIFLSLGAGLTHKKRLRDGQSSKA